MSTKINLPIRRRSSRAAQALQPSPDYVGLLENIFASVNANIAYLDLEMKITRVNPTLARIAHLPVDFFTGKSIFDVFPIASQREVFETVARTGKPYMALESAYQEDARGMTYWNWSLQQLKNVDGIPFGLLLIAVDTTDFTRAQRELKENRALLQHVFDTDPDANILTDAGGHILSINQQAEVDFGYSAVELAGKRMDMLFPGRASGGKQSQAVIHPHRITRRTQLETVGRRRDGTTFPVEVTLNPIRLEGRALIMTVARDISARHELQREIAEIQHRLIESAENERLRLAQDLHDGPIQDLYGVTYMLQSLDTEMTGRISQAEVRSSRQAINQVIGTLRDVCSNLRPTALLPFGLKRAITSHADRFQNMYPGLACHLDLSDDGVSLPESTRLALYRIYQHLVSNVARHAQAHNMWIRFKLEPEQCMVEVEDDGVGFTLPHRYLELVRKGHFGLAGATERAEAIGGSVEITTAPGKGARIRVVVPRGSLQPEPAELVAADIHP